MRKREETGVPGLRRITSCRAAARDTQQSWCPHAARDAGLSSAENWIFSDGYAERLRFEIDPSWQGDIPRTILISSDGESKTIQGSAEIADLEKWSISQLAPAK